MLLVRCSGRARGAATAAARRSCRWGSAPPGSITYAYFSLASHTLRESDYGGITLLWSAVFITVSVLYRPVEQLLSRTIADRDARGRRGQRAPARGGHDPARAGRGRSRWPRWRFRGPIQDDLFGGSATLYWVLIVAVLAYAASYFARGFLAGHRRFGLYGGLVLMEAMLARACSRWRWRSGSPRGSRWWRWAWRRRRSCRWRWCRSRSARSAESPGARRPPVRQPMRVAGAAERRAGVHARPRHRASPWPCW